MAEHLRADVGDNAAAFATLWREKTLEYWSVFETIR
jgi:hypothetical protein